MKGIKCCGECAYYNMKEHKCTGGAKDPGNAEDSFYADCPHVEAKPVRHGRWIPNGKRSVFGDLEYLCSECSRKITVNWAVADPSEYNAFCSGCGAEMREGGADIG